MILYKKLDRNKESYNKQEMNRSCYYHPQNTLHNFCINTQCSLPLCPKCINIHLNQSTSQKHHIQSLGETMQMVRQQLDIAIDAIEHNLQAIKTEQFTPQNCFKQYAQIIEKYRSQAIQKINQHYDYIKRQLFQQLKSKYSCHLGSLVVPLQEKLLQLRKNRKQLEQRPIECMIKVISQEAIMHVEKLLERVQDSKQTFKLELPRLEGVDEDKLRIVPGGVERIVSKSLKENELIDRTFTNFRSIGTARYLNEVDELDKINRLEAELYNLRSECY